jgi:parallel beta-helix repeat protein
VTVTTLPAAPAIGTGAENSNQSVTLTGTAPDGATVTVSTLTTSDGVTTALGTTTASSTGAWSFTTTALSAGSYDFTATDTTSAGTSSASSPFVVGVSSTNPDPITYYVSSEIGSDNNAGTSATAPLASLQAAEDLVQPGDTVEVMNGTYTGNAPGGGDVLDITTSGTASAPITFEAAPGQTPVINSSGGWNAINIEASYIVVEGFTVVGDAANYTSAQALAGYSTGNANLDGNGIAINPNGNVPNHITIENNTVYNEPGGGIYTEGADYVQILNNVVYDNAHWSAYGNSGISVSTSANSDTNAGVHDIISGNLVFGNAQEVPTTGGNTITDGEGIILDTNSGFVGEILVEKNTVYGNGSSGIESFLTDNAVITGNTVYGNDTENVQAANVAEIFINQSNNDTVTSNTTTAPSSTPPAAPVISTGAENSNESVTLSGTAPDGSTVTVSDGGVTALGTATASSTGAWSFTTADLSAGSYAFTATDTTSAGTSAASSPFDVTVTSSSPPPAAPVISTGAANSNESVTLTGTAPDGSTVTVSDGGATALGTATASSTGAWSFTTADLAAGSYAFTATDTTSAGTSTASSPFDVTVTSSSPPPPSGSNLVANGNFATGNSTDWTLGGNDSNASSPQLFIDTNAEGGSTYAVGMGSMGADGTLSQTIATTAGQTYTLSFWLQNEGSGGNDFAAIWNGQTLLSLTNAAQFGYTEYTYTVTATGSTTTLELSAANNPSQWDLDNISLTAKSTPPPAAPVISTGAENSNESVTLTGTAPDGSTVTVSDGGVTALGTATASSTGAWSFTTAHLAAGSYAFTATDTTSAGNVSTASSALNVRVNANLIGAVTIGSGATFELAAADSASVSFTSSTGTLILESPSTFSGKIFNFTGNGSLSGSDQIDLTNINFNSVQDSYVNGVLTVTDGTNTDKLNFHGSYTLGNFSFASDGSGGTIVYDPPAPPSSALAATSSGQTSGGQSSNFTGTVSGFGAQDVIDLPGIAFDAQTTLGYSDQTGGTLPFMDGAQSAKIALLGTYMASSFAVASDHHGGTMVTEAWQASNQSLLTHPQHA